MALEAVVPMAHWGISGKRRDWQGCGMQVGGGDRVGCDRLMDGRPMLAEMLVMSTVVPTAGGIIIGG